MSKFRISRSSPVGIAPWWLEYPIDFKPGYAGIFCTSFDEAVREFARSELERQRQQPPVILTPRQITRAGAFLRHWAADQLGVTALSVGYTEQIARALIRRVNEADL